MPSWASTTASGTSSSRVAANISAAGSPRQSCVSMSQPTSVRPSCAATAGVASACTPHGTRHSAGASPRRARRPSVRSASSRIAPSWSSVCRMWRSQCSSIRCPDATARRTRSGWRSAAGAITKNVARAPARSSASRTAGVPRGSGPSSKVSASAAEVRAAEWMAGPGSRGRADGITGRPGAVKPMCDTYPRDRRPISAASLLPDHLGGGLVLPQAEVAGVAQASGARPFGEGELGDERRLDPGDVALADRVGLAERRALTSQRAQPPAELTERVAVEAGADLARVAQVAMTVVVAEEQRAELGPAAARGGDAADHELLAGLALELQPGAGAGRAIGAVRALGDDALPALGARVGEHRLALAVAVRAQPDRPARREHVAQQPLARPQRQGPHVQAVQPQQVEHVVEDRDRTAAAVGEPGEARAPAIERDDLAVDRPPRTRLGRQRLPDLGEAAAEVEVVAGQHPQAGAVADRHATDSVELALEDPVRIAERRAAEDRLHRLRARRSGRLRRQLALLDRQLQLDAVSGACHSDIQRGVARRLSSLERRARRQPSIGYANYITHTTPVSRGSGAGSSGKGTRIRAVEAVRRTWSRILRFTFFKKEYRP